MRMLLQRGASVNLQGSLGTTVLMVAADNGYTTIVQALLDAKADASLRTQDGYTSLMHAKHQKHPPHSPHSPHLPHRASILASMCSPTLGLNFSPIKSSFVAVSLAC